MRRATASLLLLNLLSTVRPVMMMVVVMVIRGMLLMLLLLLMVAVMLLIRMRIAIASTTSPAACQYSPVSAPEGGITQCIQQWVYRAVDVTQPVT